MKYCVKCGKELHDEAVMCVGCGTFTDDYVKTNNTEANHSSSDDQLINTLSEKIKTNAIIWLVIGVIQIATALFSIVGIINIISAIRDLKYSKEVINNPVGIVSNFEPMTMGIIVLAYNLIFGGIIGVAGSIYYFVALRGFVMQNKAQFLQIENN